MIGAADQIKPRVILQGLAIGGFESNPLANEIMHDEMILLLYVAQNTKPTTRRHRKASGAKSVQLHEHILRREFEIRAAEMDHHGRIARVAHSSRGETKLQPVERPIRRRVRNLRFHRLKPNTKFVTTNVTQKQLLENFGRIERNLIETVP